ncbi:hypothetical protein CBS147333_7622 [Penicillium roqueforti]|uniref:uncharacterized protein n=1 Tax=Penicillium roqueforti TaxID=5082 RepID=UPI00190D2847|nr:uncharacterized protein LCP9604111_3723 [Penicillium roqueforti]KAF9250207.1 hypothetical protein LCP9604111_3723 [Penicillium roqueforti]KAI2676307.1 hypothetical protein LCP963914a_8269 [Penicillium roqueforti]KAI2700945.1 hypothetical protein CBS147372_5015 [Penicillium roqueforti]KAI2717163.1 hypothetical protein CBS147318_5290 [Penicillium roqueforti]KAI2727267.1 hypothetical protein CBS147354_3469 [Penicillium roqueforti]
MPSLDDLIWRQMYRRDERYAAKQDSSDLKYLPILSCRSFKGLSSQFYFGEGSFNRRQALILSEIEGITLRELAKQVESNIEEETLELSLENAFGESYKLGAEHYDLNLDSKLGNSASVWAVRTI